MNTISRFRRSWQDLRRFQHLKPQRRDICFYSEAAAYGVFFKPVVEHLIDNLDRPVCYLTSDPDDPVLGRDHPNLDAFYIGRDIAKVFMFRGLQAGVMVMTLPDLDVYHVRRSAYPVHYVHLFHSMVSTHMIYRTHAFDHFDSLMCVGPHHKREVREWEQINGLPEKELFEHGYGPLDTLLACVGSDAPFAWDGESPLRILVAPSWGPNGLLETRGADLVDILLAAGHHVAVRPHPRTRELTSTVLDDLDAQFSEHPNFSFDENTALFEPLLASDVLISDWSGVALEYAFGLTRPVLFIDVPRKVNNPDYTHVSSLPIEVALREEIGAVLPLENLDQAPAAAATLCRDWPPKAEHVRRLRDESIYNVGSSGRAGADIIVQLVDRQLESAGANR